MRGAVPTATLSISFTELSTVLLPSEISSVDAEFSSVMLATLLIAMTTSELLADTSSAAADILQLTQIAFCLPLPCPLY